MPVTLCDNIGSQSRTGSATNTNYPLSPFPPPSPVGKMSAQTPPGSPPMWTKFAISGIAGVSGWWGKNEMAEESVVGLGTRVVTGFGGGKTEFDVSSG
eukprot:820222-Amorphochlora_amoeboformis.AAC.2